MSSPLRIAIVVAVAYAVIGVVTADLAAAAGAPSPRIAWRWAAWVLSLLLFAGQILFERRRVATSPARIAAHAALAVAVGSFLLALAGPVRAHWGSPTRGRALLALVLWPALASIPAYLAAYALAALLGRRGAQRGSSGS